MLGYILFVSIPFDLLGFTIYFLCSSGVGQYSIPRRFVIQRQAPALLSSCISSNAPEDNKEKKWGGGVGGCRLVLVLVLVLKMTSQEKERTSYAKDPWTISTRGYRTVWLVNHHLLKFSRSLTELTYSCRPCNLPCTLFNFYQWNSHVLQWYQMFLCSSIFKTPHLNITLEV